MTVSGEATDSRARFALLLTEGLALTEALAHEEEELLEGLEASRFTR